MKVEITKKHYNYAIGKIVDTRIGIAEKLIRLGVAKEVVEGKESTAVEVEEPKKPSKKK
jgi:hypothetical protein